VHGICGAWGTLAVGFFIREDLLGDMTRGGQIGIQALGVAVCFAWAFGLGLLFYFLVDRLAGGVRVDEEHELIGLNVAEHGATSSLLELANSMDELTRTGAFEGHKGVPVDYGTEVGDLAELFNKMIGRISGALKESRDQKNKAEELLKTARKQQEYAANAENALKMNQLESREKRKDYIDQASMMVGSVVEKAFLIKDRMVKTSGVTDEMNSSIQELSDTLGHMLSALSTIYSNVGEVDDVTREASSRAAHTRVTVGELNSITGEITEMINFINEIAERTHLLSINTAIEAARAAEHGKGFTVISQEVQHLSHETTTAVSSIEDKVRGIESRISNVVSSMDQIAGIVEKISSLNRAIVETVEKNENYTQSLEEQSRQTISAVEGVRDDVHTVVSRMEEVTTIGEDVRNNLKKMG
ncbi:MAG: methyl-accepting chemotaxis protein, partial [Spirochaetales bacterium]|nr:methyl-accepting chemotaxis protein [Spirochaetales bacterium]